MKYLFILLSFCLFGCFTKDFEIIETTSQKWIGGMPGSGRGTNYKIKILPYKSSDKLQIDKIWIGNEYFEVKAITNPKDRNSTGFEKLDTLYIDVHQYIRTNQNGEIVKTEVKGENSVPKEYEGEALIGFLYKGKRKYKTIEAFNKLKLIPYP